MIQLPLRLTLFPYTSLFRSSRTDHRARDRDVIADDPVLDSVGNEHQDHEVEGGRLAELVANAVQNGIIGNDVRSEEHTSELQSHSDLVCRLLLEKKKKKNEK